MSSDSPGGSRGPVHRAVLHVDGGARGNPGPAAAGIVLTDPADDQPIFEQAVFLGRQTNNAAEYMGLIAGLKRAGELNLTHLTVVSDSQLMVRQLLGEYRVKSATLRPLFEQARQLISQFEQCELTHVKRDQNKRADQLANMAMDEKRDVIV